MLFLYFVVGMEFSPLEDEGQTGLSQGLSPLEAVENQRKNGVSVNKGPNISDQLYNQLQMIDDIEVVG